MDAPMMKTPDNAEERVVFAKRGLSAALALLLLCACVLFTVFFLLFADASNADGSVTPDRVLYTLYADDGFAVLALAALSVVSLLHFAKKSIAARVIFWVALLLAFRYAAQFFGNLYNLEHLSFQQGLVYAGETLPGLLLALGMIATLCEWDRGNKKTALAVCWVCFLVCAFLSCFFARYKLTAYPLDEPLLRYDALFGLMHAIIMPVALLFLCASLQNAERFKLTFIE